MGKGGRERLRLDAEVSNGGAWLGGEGEWEVGCGMVLTLGEICDLSLFFWSFMTTFWFCF